MRTKAMRLSGKLQMAKNRKHYCRPALKSCDFHFGVGHSLEQRLGHGCAWAGGQRCRVPNSHAHSCFNMWYFKLRKKNCLCMHSGWTLALSCSVLCLSVRLGFGSIHFECITWFSISCPKWLASKRTPGNRRHISTTRSISTARTKLECNASKPNTISSIDTTEESKSSVQFYQSNLSTKLPSSTGLAIDKSNLASDLLQFLMRHLLP